LISVGLILLIIFIKRKKQRNKPKNKSNIEENNQREQKNETLTIENVMANTFNNSEGTTTLQSTHQSLGIYLYSYLLKLI